MFPVSVGHALVVPCIPVLSIFELDESMQAELWDTVRRVRGILEERFHPAGFNIGVNDGPAAGQTVPHAHVHVIPRYAGDVPDPRGGIRWVIPEKARYWDKPAAVRHRGEAIGIGDRGLRIEQLIQCLWRSGRGRDRDPARGRNGASSCGDAVASRASLPFDMLAS